MALKSGAYRDRSKLWKSFGNVEILLAMTRRKRGGAEGSVVR